MHELDTFGSPQGTSWDLTSPAEIRRRGEALTRRRRVRVSAAVAVLSAVVTLPHVSAWIGPQPPTGLAQDASRTATPSTPVRGAWLSKIPAGFTLGDDMTTATPATARDGAEERQLRPMSICGDESWGDQPGLADMLVATSREEGAATEQRVLFVYRDETHARAAVGTVREAAARCASSEEGGDPLVALVVDVGTVDEAWGYTVPHDDGGRPLLVVRVGNSLLVSKSRALGRSRSTVDDRQADQIRHTARKMCVFAVDAC